MERDSLFPEPMVYSLVHIFQSGLYYETGGKPMMAIHRSPRRKEAYIKCGEAWFPAGDRLRHCYYCTSAMQPSARHLPRSFGQTRALLASECHSNPLQVTPPHLLPLPRDQGYGSPRKPEVRTGVVIMGSPRGCCATEKEIYMFFCHL